MNPGFKLLTTFLVCISFKQKFTFKLVMSVYNLIATGCLKAKEQISNPTKLQQQAFLNAKFSKCQLLYIESLCSDILTHDNSFDTKILCFTVGGAGMAQW